MTRPLVSIIIPAYKAENFIREALMSVKAQTYTNWEVIVVEDASKDRTEEIVMEFAREVSHHHVQYIRNPHNQGPGVTRNIAMKQAKGDYLAFLDHDDLWKETHLENTLTYLEKEGGDLAYSTVQLFENGTNKNLGFWGPDEQDLQNFPASLFARNYIQPLTVVMKKSILETVGFFDPNFRSAEDLDYWLRIASAGFSFVYVPGIHSFYRKKHSSASTSNQKVIEEGHARVLRKHRNLKIIPESIRNSTAVKYHLEVAKNNWQENTIKTIEFLFWSWKISPLNSVIYFTHSIAKKLF